MKIGIIGGHFTPALAVIEQIKNKEDIVFIGRKYTFEGDTAISLEYKTITEFGIKFEILTTGRLQRKFTRHTLPSLFKFPKGTLRALAILKKHKIAVVLSFGGYLSLPVCIAAKMLGISIVIHEQTLGAGAANKFVGRFANKICVSWNTSEKYFPKQKVVVTGNPMRQTLFNIKSEKFQFLDKLPVLYITGGSAGAHAINVLIEDHLQQLLEDFNVIHQTGDAGEFGDYVRLTNKKTQLPKELQRRYFITKFVDPDYVGAIYNKSALVISRSGINTITELLYFGKPAMLIPLPIGQKNEQLTNARFLERLGLAKVLLQPETDSQKLFFALHEMLRDRDQYLAKAENGKKYVRKDAAEKILEVVNLVLH